VPSKKPEDCTCWRKDCPCLGRHYAHSTTQRHPLEGQEYDRQARDGEPVPSVRFGRILLSLTSVVRLMVGRRDFTQLSVVMSDGSGQTGHLSIPLRMRKTRKGTWCRFLLLVRLRRSSPASRDCLCLGRRGGLICGCQRFLLRLITIKMDGEKQRRRGVRSLNMGWIHMGHVSKWSRPRANGTGQSLPATNILGRRRAIPRTPKDGELSLFSCSDKGGEAMFSGLGWPSTLRSNDSRGFPQIWLSWRGDGVSVGLLSRWSYSGFLSSDRVFSLLSPVGNVSRPATSGDYRTNLAERHVLRFCSKYTKRK
jgi:hypothetical protein